MSGLAERDADFSFQLRDSEYVAGMFGRAGGSVNKIGFYIGGSKKATLSKVLALPSRRLCDLQHRAETEFPGGAGKTT